MRLTETKGEKMIKVDDRSPDQRKTHVWGVVCKDKFMSGWGMARGGASRCAWACAPDVDPAKVISKLRDHREKKYLNIVNLKTYRVPRGTAHFHIYVCNVDHPLAR